MTAEAVIMLPSWPQKAVSKKESKNIDIALCVSEVFSPDLRQIVKCKAAVGYFLRQPRGKEVECAPILEVLYEFENPPQEAHPIFHAHIDSTKWPEVELRRLGLPGPIVRPNPAPPIYHNARIPTAFMGFISTLVAVAADHLEPRNYRSVAFAAWDALAVDAEPDCSLLTKRLGGRPRGHLWYDERYVVHQWQHSRNRWKGAIPLLGEVFEAGDSAGVRRHAIETLDVHISRVVFVDGAPSVVRA
jgi:hypothetical protein